MEGGGIEEGKEGRYNCKGAAGVWYIHIDGREEKKGGREGGREAPRLRDDDLKRKKEKRKGIERELASLSPASHERTKETRHRESENTSHLKKRK